MRIFAFRILEAFPFYVISTNLLLGVAIDKICLIQWVRCLITGHAFRPKFISSFLITNPVCSFWLVCICPLAHFLIIMISATLLSDGSSVAIYNDVFYFFRIAWWAGLWILAARITVWIMASTKSSNFLLSKFWTFFLFFFSFVLTASTLKLDSLCEDMNLLKNKKTSRDINFLRQKKKNSDQEGSNRARSI